MAYGERVRKRINQMPGFELQLGIVRKNFTFPFTDEYVEEHEVVGGRGCGARTFLGRFFEETAVSMIGGRINEKTTRLDDCSIKPDIDYGNGKWGEAKSCLTGLLQKIEKEQLSKFARWLSKNPDTKLDFFFFQHSARGILANYTDINTLLDSLRKNIVFCIKSPIIVPLQFYINPEVCKRMTVAEYTGPSLGERGYSDRTVLQISRLFLRDFFENPGTTLDSIGLDPQAFTYKRYKVNGLTVNRKRIEPFLFLDISIEDDNYSKWLEKEGDKLREFGNYSLEWESKRERRLSSNEETKDDYDGQPLPF